MPRDFSPARPRRTDDGLIDTAYYIRRAHALRSQDICGTVRRGLHAVLRTFHIGV